MEGSIHGIALSFVSKLHLGMLGYIFYLGMVGNCF